MPNKLLYLICGVVTRWEQYLGQRDLGRTQPLSRFCGCCGKGLAPLFLILQTAGSQQQLPGSKGGRNQSGGDKLFPAQPCCQSPGDTKEPFRSCLAGKAETGCLVPGERAGAGGLQKAAQSRKTHGSASAGSRAVYTLSSHLGCLLQVHQVLFLYPSRDLLR